MRGQPLPAARPGLCAWTAFALAALAWAGAPAPAQPVGAPPAEPRKLSLGEAQPVPAADPPKVDANVVPASCASCGGGLLGAAAGDFPGCGCGGGCVPGRDKRYCCGCDCDGPLGRFLCGVYDCICCPDPCYEPRWLAIADSAFFVDSARPVTQMRIRLDSGLGWKQPDRAEFFWPRERVTSATPGTGKGPAGVATHVDDEELSLYTEAATGAFGLFVEIPYRELDVTSNPALPVGSASGFADMNVGTKAVMLDCQLLQCTFQFKTFIPIGNFTRGLGTGHVSLEPSLLLALRLTPDDYIQSQLAFWIPIGGDKDYQGDIFHAHVSYNHTLWQPFHGLQLVGTLEVNEWSILDGRYTAAFVTPDGKGGLVAASVSAADSTVVSAGPGVRLFVCDKIDFGVGTAFSLTGVHWAEELIRAEFRWRF
jgi:hypothetical protein